MYVLIVALVGVVVRVAIWEKFYYAEKEGSTRAKAPEVDVETGEVYDESDVTDTQKREHVVAADKPRYLSIPKLNIQTARVIEVGIDGDNRMGTPVNIFDVGWLRNTGRPGGGGVLMMDGHNGGPTRNGVFKYLDKLVVGDLILVERGDGAIFTYRVVENKVMSVTEADAYMDTMALSPEAGREALSLITCTGGWIQTQRTYDSRAMVRAVLVDE
jgi:LPXTG-site transpeptidase (sortase) family protein